MRVCVCAASERRNKLCSNSALPVPLNCLTSLSTVSHATAGLPSCDVTVTSRNSRGIASRRRSRPQTVMADVENDRCNGVRQTRNEQFVVETRRNDDNNNQNNDDIATSTKNALMMTSEETYWRRCEVASAAQTQVSGAQSAVRCGVVNESANRPMFVVHSHRTGYQLRHTPKLEVKLFFIVLVNSVHAANGFAPLRSINIYLLALLLAVQTSVYQAALRMASRLSVCHVRLSVGPVSAHNLEVRMLWQAQSWWEGGPCRV